MRVYLDANATSPLRPEAHEAMLDAAACGGNPSSSHREGARARRIVEAARAEVAALIGAAPSEIVFTSGASEANTLALSGLAPRHLVTTAIEHASVLEAARVVTGGGDALTIVPVDPEARVSPAAVAEAVRAPVTLVSIGLANGEVGTVQCVAAIVEAIGSRGARVHTDAAQAAGRIPVDVRALGVDLLSLSGHKLGGPTGVGALWIRQGLEIVPQIVGGPQERGRRAGTENVIGIAGFGAAVRVARTTLAETVARLTTLRERLWEGIHAWAPDVIRNGPTDGALPQTLNVTFPGVAGESALVLCDLAGLALSIGSACAAGAAAPSHVLLAMGRDRAAARSGLRLSLGWHTTDSDIDRAIAVLRGVVAQVRAGRAA